MAAELLDDGLGWALEAAWLASAGIAAMYFRVDPAAIQAPSRGRGPRPAAEVRAPKKIAVYLAVVLSDASYADLARFVGLHKDTVAAHCAEVRNACASSRRFETLIDSLRALAVVKLENVRHGAPKLDENAQFIRQLDHGSRPCDAAVWQ